ncbi:MAG: hypothetical protein ABWU13_23180 [Limnospira maxima]
MKSCYHKIDNIAPTGAQVSTGTDARATMGGIGMVKKRSPHPTSEL